jgi:hypothetical protein
LRYTRTARFKPREKWLLRNRLAVYGNVALATDHTIFKAVDANKKLAVTGEARVLRIFVKENGRWRPAAAALVGLPAPK